MKRSVWSIDGVSEYPLKQPMVGQKKFYNIFNNFVTGLSSAGMARIFPLIADWGIGKSRIGFELVSQVIGKDKGWIIRNDNGEPEEVRILEDGFDDKILPIYISYNHMTYDYLGWDTWVPFGTYISLKKLAKVHKSNNLSLHEEVALDLVNHLEPMGFSQSKLKDILNVDEHNDEYLLENDDLLAEIINNAYEYFKQFGIERFMIIADEVESESELSGISDDQERKKKLDGEAIQLISHAIKHENERSKYPYISFLLLCSPAIGDQFEGLGALDRRKETLKIEQNSFADINLYIEHLKKNSLIPDYPDGLVEAAYTIAGGNFGWFNVIMGYVDQYLNANESADTAEIFLDCLQSVARFEKVLDKASLDYLKVPDRYKELVKKHLLMQLPQPENDFSPQELNALKNAKTEMDEPVFAEFKIVELEKPEIASFLAHQGNYENKGGDQFSNKYGGTFDLDILLKSIKTFSLQTDEYEYLVGADKPTFIDQIRMLYPEQEAESAGELMYDHINKKIKQDKTYIGPSFSFLSRFDKQYASATGNIGYLADSERNKRFEDHLEELKADRTKEADRVVKGFCRIINKNYPEIIDPNLAISGMRIKFNDAIVPLLIHPKNYVDVIWGQDTTKLKQAVKGRTISQEGVHPIFILGGSSALEQEIEEIKQDLPRVGRGIIFISLNKLQQEILEVLSVDKDYLDLTDSKNFTRQFRSRIGQIQDLIQDKAKEWFELIDEQGWVLRPIKPDTRRNTEVIKMVAEGFKKMLTNDKSLLELGSMDDEFVRENYEDFKKILPKLEVPKKFSNKNYQAIGLFKHQDEDYYAQIPPCLPRLLSYIDDKKVSWKEIEKDFYFSLKEAAATGKSMMKIIRQLAIFLKTLKTLEIDDDHYSRQTKTDLEFKYHTVKNWMDEKYDRILDNLAKVIEKGTIASLKDTYKHEYNKKVSDAKIAIDSIDIDKLKKVSINNLKVWKEIVHELEIFNRNCDYVYNDDKWNKLEYNADAISELKPLEESQPIWERLRYIQLFHEYINKIKAPATDKICQKIDELIEDNKYISYEIPVTPITLILKEYKKEISYSTDVEKTKTIRLDIDLTEMVAHYLKKAEYSQALNRLKTILKRCGLQLSDSGVEWLKSGLIEKYNQVKKDFKQIIDDYESNKDEIERWNNFFNNAPTSWKDNNDFNNLDSISRRVKTFIETGLKEIIDDAEDDGKISDLLEIMEKEVTNYKNLVQQLKGTIKSVRNFVRDKKNNWYDKDLIEAINHLRDQKNTKQFHYDKSELPKEDNYKDAEENVEELMRELKVEGQDYFDGIQTKFDFYKKVVKDSKKINWNNYQQEQKELLDKGLIEIEIKVV